MVVIPVAEAKARFKENAMLTAKLLITVLLLVAVPFVREHKHEIVIEDAQSGT